jgi:hypothetical protein
VTQARQFSWRRLLVEKAFEKQKGGCHRDSRRLILIVAADVNPLQ